MSYRKMMYIALLFILLTTSGCSLFRFVDNSSPEDIQKFETSKDDLWNQKKALEQEKAAHLKQLADQQAQIILMHRGMSDQQTKIAHADKQIAESNKIIEDLTIQVKLLEEEKEKTVTVKEPEPVLSGFGRVRRRRLRPARSGVRRKSRERNRQRRRRQ
ncbi:MAG: hypothetical protein M1418_03710 [Deltaproteobacteria bacterium]|nr:hypothetical protein [Deltaproteobacteria bacterium]